MLAILMTPLPLLGFLEFFFIFEYLFILLILVDYSSFSHEIRKHRSNHPINPLRRHSPLQNKFALL